MTYADKVPDTDLTLCRLRATPEYLRRNSGGGRPRSPRAGRLRLRRPMRGHGWLQRQAARAAGTRAGGRMAPA